MIQEITVQHKKGLPFVAYRKPGKSLVNVLLQQNKEVFFAEDFSEKGFVFAPFDSNSKALLIPEKEAEIFKAKFENELSKKENHLKNDEIPAFAGMGKHLQLVEKGIQAIKKGLFQKVVLSRKQEVGIEAENPFQIFENLLKSYPQAFCYCWFHPKTGLWMGATPESLLEVESGFLKTMALAGTQKYNGNLDVSWGEKEKEEQKLVTDYIVSELEGKLENLEISEVETIRAGNLLHLKTRIAGKFSSSSLKEIIRALHPTPAVCGLPKEAAKNFILKNENYDRKFYTGFLGELNSGEKTDLYVNLRCMKIENQKTNLYIGGGITKDSKPESEWEETVNKAGTMLRVLKIDQMG